LRAIFGAAVGVAFPNTGPCIRALVTPSKLTAAFGVLAVNVGLWMLLSPLVMGTLLTALPGGWHGVYGIIGLIGVVFAVCDSALIPKFPESHPSTNPMDIKGVVYASALILGIMT
ncbi:major facilitator superfamily protein, partial [Kipferlia bialata]